MLDGKWHCSAFDLNTGSLCWLTRLRSPGAWCPVEFGRYWVVGSRDGHIAVLDPQRELKVWEGAVGGRHEQPPAVGQVAGRTLLATASNDQGLKVFEIDPFYTSAVNA